MFVMKALTETLSVLFRTQTIFTKEWQMKKSEYVGCVCAHYVSGQEKSHTNVCALCAEAPPLEFYTCVLTATNQFMSNANQVPMESATAV